MSILTVDFKSDEFERKALEKIDKLSEEKKNLELSLSNKTNLISADKLIKELDITNTTLSKWISLGLKVYRPPVENSKKRYFKISDVVNFFVVG
ncbi:hypothetical protein [Streptococcus porcinus]|uniref:Phage protein n=1 Tax=Streptococcus porcinus TaxID=1340 RepID=A0A4V0H9V7_STRPO|nr:hypothetical protein [Streptococcus porcinus]VTT44603.1 phage protein [Streptococcus porcinus]VTT45963.1 phage protein [Streptococcus porcinus]